MMTQRQSPRSSLSNADEFVINDCCAFRYTPSNEYFAQAHAVTAFLTVSASEAGSADKLPANQTIVMGVLEAVQTLLTIGLLAQQNERLSAERF